MPKLNTGKKKSKTGDHFTTPPRVVELIHRFFGGVPDLDPCSNENSIVGAMTEWYGPAAGGRDGIIMSWRHVERSAERASPGHVAVFMNPPFSDKYAWCKKAFQEWQAGGVEVIGLLPADTDTRWFHHFTVPAPAKCFWKGRLTFGGDASNVAMFPVVLPYWGPRPGLFRRIFTSYGWVP